jgi:plastocyanin
MSINRHDPLSVELQRRMRAGILSRRDAVRLLAAFGLTTAGTSTPRGVYAQEATPESPSMATPALGLRPDGTRMWRVQVSGGSEADLLEFMTFFPRELTINAGDTVFFDFQGLFAPHTVTFLAGQEIPPLIVPADDTAATPAGGGPPTVMFNSTAAFPAGGAIYDGTSIVNSGLNVLRPPDQPFALTFTTPGTFDYLCLVHPKMMTGTVTVQTQGATVPHEQADVDAMAVEHMAMLLDEGRAMIAGAEAMATPGAGPNGGTVWDVRAGDEGHEFAALRFFPGQLTIKAGDTVRWTADSEFEPHTVTFLGGDEPPDLVMPEPQEGGPPRLIINPAVVGRAGGPVYGGTGYANSGTMGADFAPFTGLTTYELTFDTPGEYLYYCALHGSPTRGMRATVTVT